MPTSTLIQYLDTVDSAGVDLGVTPSARRSVETYIARTTITTGDAVVFDNTATGSGAQGIVVATAAFNAAGRPGIVGVCLSGVVGTVGAPKLVRVVTSGLVVGRVAAATAAGALVSCTAANGVGAAVATGAGAATADSARAAATSYATTLDAEATGVALMSLSAAS